jgi:transposase
MDQLQREIQLARVRFGLGGNCPVKSCYEAGREGFSLHRALTRLGIENIILDASSIEVPRRGRRVKTDRLDVIKLVRLLCRYHGGEPEVCSVVRVPSREEEDQRHLHREMGTLKELKTSQAARIKSLLVSQGIYWNRGVGRLTGEALGRLRTLEGLPLEPALRARLERELSRWQEASRQLKELQRQQRELLRMRDNPIIQMVLTLMKVRGMGLTSAWLLVMELFAWRKFRNRRQVGALSGMTGSHHQSGDSSHDQGIARHANYRIRGLLVELAWLWIRHQPQSELTLWYQRRFGSGSKRVRKIGIVAVARRLLIALWRLLDHGEIPAGAELKA